MARKCYISSDMSHDEDLIDVCDEDSFCGLLWPWLLTAFDDWGRAKASPKRLKSELFPSIDVVTVEVIEKALELFHKHGLITLYQVNEKPYMCIDPEKWWKWQTHIRKEKRENDNSKHPAPDDANIAQVREDARDNAQISDNLADCIPSPSPSLSPSPSINNAAIAIEDDQMKLMDEYCRLHGKGDWQIKATCRQAMQDILKVVPLDFVIDTMKKIHQKKTDEGDRVNSFTFYIKPITEAYAETTKQVDPTDISTKRSYQPRRGHSSKPVIPIIQHNQSGEDVSDEEYERILNKVRSRRSG